MKSYINLINLKKKTINFKKIKPFPLVVIDNFFKRKYALKLHQEFPELSNSTMGQSRTSSPLIYCSRAC